MLRANKWLLIILVGLSTACTRIRPQPNPFIPKPPIVVNPNPVVTPPIVITDNHAVAAEKFEGVIGLSVSQLVDRVGLPFRTVLGNPTFYHYHVINSKGNVTDAEITIRGNIVTDAVVDF